MLICSPNLEIPGVLLDLLCLYCSLGWSSICSRSPKCQVLEKVSDSVCFLWSRSLTSPCEGWAFISVQSEMLHLQRGCSMHQYTDSMGGLSSMFPVKARLPVRWRVQVVLGKLDDVSSGKMLHMANRLYLTSLPCFSYFLNTVKYFVYFIHRFCSEKYRDAH